MAQQRKTRDQVVQIRRFTSRTILVTLYNVTIWAIFNLYPFKRHLKRDHQPTIQLSARTSNSARSKNHNNSNKALMRSHLPAVQLERMYHPVLPQPKRKHTIRN